MATDLKSILSSQLPIDNSGSIPNKQLSIDAVDKLADELVTDYNNVQFRQWYCGVIYQYGYAQVSEWRNRAKEGREPAKLFSKYVKDARTFKRSKSVPE